MPRLTRLMFGITGMNVFKVEKTRPCLRLGCLRSRRLHSICSRLKRDQWCYAVLKDLKEIFYIKRIEDTYKNSLPTHFEDLKIIWKNVAKVEFD